jgi:hypothetical protein
MFRMSQVTSRMSRILKSRLGNVCLIIHTFVSSAPRLYLGLTGVNIGLIVSMWTTVNQGLSNRIEKAIGAPAVRRYDTNLQESGVQAPRNNFGVIYSRESCLWTRGEEREMYDIFFFTQC